MAKSTYRRAQVSLQETHERTKRGQAGKRGRYHAGLGGAGGDTPPQRTAQRLAAAGMDRGNKESAQSDRRARSQTNGISAQSRITAIVSYMSALSDTVKRM
jgi:hypothetical protein